MTAAFREYLYRPQHLRERLQCAEERLSEVWSTCTRMTAQYGGCGGAGGGGGSSKDGVLAAYSDLHNTDRLRREYNEAVADMERFLHAVETADARCGKRDAIILRQRYLKQKSWEETLPVLQHAGYRCGHIQTAYHWHRSALRRGEQLWEETHESRLHADSGL